jgi:hypothetical protein
VQDCEGVDAAGVDARAEAEWRTAIAVRSAGLELPHAALSEEVESSCLWIEGVQAPLGVADV